MINIDYKKETFLSGPQWKCIVGGQIIGFIELTPKKYYHCFYMHQDHWFASTVTLKDAKRNICERFAEWLQTIKTTEE